MTTIERLIAWLEWNQRPCEERDLLNDALEELDSLAARLAAAEARNKEASKALVLAWGGVCPLDWECDCTNWQMMAEQIRSRGDELQTRLSAAEAAIKAQEEEAARTHDAWGEEVNAYAARLAAAEAALQQCSKAAQNPDLDLTMLQAAILFTVESTRSGQVTQ